VWICLDPFGHLQATGRDRKGRKQYRYHPQFRSARDRAKFHRLIPFAKHLPRIRRRIHRDIRRKRLCREKVLAAVVLLLERTMMRIGNEEYVHENHSYGLTTLRSEHVAVHGASIEFHFRGKSGMRHAIDITDPRLARIVHACQELPGQHLFEYRDDNGRLQPVTSQDVNDYLRRDGEQFTAKDYRTWKGTVLAATYLSQVEKPRSERMEKKSILQAVRRVAQALGNTPAVCRTYYIHPLVIDSFRRGTLSVMRSRRQSSIEYAVLKLLKSHA